MARRRAETYVSCHNSEVASYLNSHYSYTLKPMQLTHRSPRRSMTYALTPPGILTSTRMSTREKALKQLKNVLKTASLEKRMIHQ